MQGVRVATKKIVSEGACGKPDKEGGVNLYWPSHLRHLRLRMQRC